MNKRFWILLLLTPAVAILPHLAAQQVQLDNGALSGRDDLRFDKHTNEPIVIEIHQNAEVLIRVVKESLANTPAVTFAVPPSRARVPGVDSTNEVKVYGDDIPPGFKQTNVATTLQPPEALSVRMRKAMMMARNQAAPWTTRFIVTAVEERTLTEPGKDDQGLPNGLSTWTTNYIVILQPVAINLTNLPVAFGATKAGTLRMRLEYPVKVGDKLDLAPVPPPGSLDPR